jgi:hypothetical protein
MPALYDAEVRHVRRQQLDRSFRHALYLWLVDLDALPELPRALRPFARFEARDHLGDPHRTIRENLDAWLAGQGVDLRGGQVLMLANARAFGHVFNPITVYWCHGPDGALECVVAEVHNTYGERHCYLLRPDETGRATTAKDFHVSPFFSVDGQYDAPARPRRPARDLRDPAPGRRDGVHRHARGHPHGGVPGRTGPDAAAPPVHDPPHVGADPPPRHRPVAAQAARHPPAETHSAGGRPMTIERARSVPAAPRVVVKRSNNHVVPRPNEGVWPGLSTPPHVPARARIAEVLFRRRCGRCPCAWCSPAASGSARAGRARR